MGGSSLVESKQTFSDNGNYSNQVSPTSKHGFSAIFVPKNNPRFENTKLKHSAIFVVDIYITEKHFYCSVFTDCFFVPLIFLVNLATFSSTNGEKTIPGERLLFFFKTLYSLLRTFFYSHKNSDNEFTLKFSYAV